MIRIGLTGGIGSGKSTAASMFAKRGLPVIDADEIARELVAPEQPAYREIVEAFGEGIVDQNGQIDRAHLRRLVFNDKTLRGRLEVILHPRVRAEIQRRLQHLDAAYCVIVIPLLIEAHQRDLVDRVLVIDVGEDVQLQRVAARGQLDEEEIRKIVAAQLSRGERLRHADDVVSNDGDLQSLEAQVALLHERYLSLARES